MITPANFRTLLTLTVLLLAGPILLFVNGQSAHLKRQTVANAFERGAVCNTWEPYSYYR